jgi:hypothetical protein
VAVEEDRHELGGRQLDPRALATEQRLDLDADSRSTPE